MIPELPKSDRVLLQVAHRLVPASERSDWMRSWQAELWHRRHPRAHKTQGAAVLYPGVLGDALWLRTESHRRAFAGTAILCLACLCAGALVAAAPLIPLLGGMAMVSGFLVHNVLRFGCEASLVTLVSLARTARFTECNSGTTPLARIRANFFYGAKLVLVLLMPFFLSLDLMQALRASHAFTAEVTQPEVFVLLALLALRWSFRDNEGRCKHCLRTLAVPTRVGRPSWNFLDTNGTELLCEDGHGLLSIPEMETSWRQSSQWIAG